MSYVLIGLLGGIAGGMGLGGGTILIPFISIFLGVVQKQAQFLNVFSFVIMAFFIIFIYIKTKFIDIFPALLFAIIGAVCAIFSALIVSPVSSLIILHNSSKDSLLCKLLCSKISLKYVVLNSEAK